MKRLRHVTIAMLLAAALALGARIAAPLLGRALIRSDRPAHADMIVVLGSWRVERTAEAGMLFREGWSPRIMLLRSPNGMNASDIRRLNLHLPMWLDIQKDVLRQMGVPASAIIESPGELRTTREEAAFIAAEARRSKMRRIIIVTSPYHTARAGHYVRGVVPSSIEVVMIGNRYEPVDPGHWWRRPIDRHEVLLEYLSWLYGLLAR